MATNDEGVLPERVRDLAEPIARDLGVEVLDVTITGGKGRRLVRLTADAAELDAAAGLDIDTIATMSRRLGDVLDEHDLLPGAYTLEVTSPGADRPLTRPRDFARNAGREVRVTRHGDDEDATPLTGEVVATTDAAVTLATPAGEVEVPFEDIDHGKVVLPW
jgi:ribosome maturation factor RimP